jgi:ATP adenylyltransferase
VVPPYKHSGELDDLSEQELAELMLLTRRCQQILKRALRPDGFNIDIHFGRCAGAGALFVDAGRIFVTLEAPE